jgi:uncharacterized protein YdbL (DUF1318 family)
MQARIIRDFNTFTAHIFARVARQSDNTNKTVHSAAGARLKAKQRAGRWQPFQSLSFVTLAAHLSANPPQNQKVVISP